MAEPTLPLEVPETRDAPAQRPLTDTLAAKLARVMGRVGWVEKRGQNTAQNYAFVTEADVLNTVRPLLAEEGIAVIPEVISLTFREIQGNSGKVIPIATVMERFTFTDGVETYAVTTVGEGMDSGDKAVYKAMTGALKYAIRQVVLVSTGDDPEKDDRTSRKVDGEDRPARRAPVTPEQKDRSDKRARLLAAFRRGAPLITGSEMLVWIREWLDIPADSPREIKSAQGLGDDELDVCIARAEQRWP